MPVEAISKHMKDKKVSRKSRCGKLRLTNLITFCDERTSSVLERRAVQNGQNEDICIPSAIYLFLF